MVDWRRRVRQWRRRREVVERRREVGCPSEDLDLLANNNITTNSMPTRGRRSPHPPSTILQASRGAERRSEYLVGGARGGVGGGEQGVSRSFWHENFIPSTLSRGLDVDKLMSQLSAERFGQV